MKPDARTCKDVRELEANKAESMLKCVLAGKGAAQVFNGATSEGSGTNEHPFQKIFNFRKN
jgi:hypothetical protein